MASFCVRGGRALRGKLRVPGAKNAILPILAASLLTKERIELNNCPRLLDVENMMAILRLLGCDTGWEGNTIYVDAKNAYCYEMPEKLAKEMRSSIFLLGPAVARFGKALFTYPGGCEIGNRPIDLHLQGLSELNVHIREEQGKILCDGHDMRGAEIHLDYPSVGATENIMLAATMAPGQTLIRNAAREPEIQDLQDFLNQIGAAVSGAGTSTVIIWGRRELGGTKYSIIPDRIVAGTLMTASAITGGEVLLENVRADHMHAVFSKLRECGCVITLNGSTALVQGPKRPMELRLIETLPYPGFPTDMQAQMFALATISCGTSIIRENVFENRFKHAAELARMGADSTVKDRMAIIRGVDKLCGAQVTSRDLRGGAALVLAGLRAEGETVVDEVHLIDRGYERLENMLGELGADITRRP